VPPARLVVIVALAAAGALAAALVAFDLVAFLSRWIAPRLGKRPIATISRDQYELSRRHPYYRWALLAAWLGFVAFGCLLWWHFFYGFGVTILSYPI
jgi:hypothetical protein